jgi:hypothetical protein
MSVFVAPELSVVFECLFKPLLGSIGAGEFMAIQGGWFVSHSYNNTEL